MPDAAAADDDITIQLAALHERSWGWALACCGRDEHLAQDVLQDAYCRAVARVPAFAGRASLHTWFCGIIRRTAAQWRRRRRGIALDHDHPAHDQAAPGRALEEREQAARVHNALRQLSPRQHAILHLVFYQDLSVEQAAAVLGIGVGSARQHYHRGKQRLLRLLDETPSPERKARHER